MLSLELHLQIWAPGRLDGRCTSERPGRAAEVIVGWEDTKVT